MKKEGLKKDTLREIKNTISKYISIILIVGLGVFVFVGLVVTGPLMRDTFEKYVDDTNFQDLAVISPMGLKKKDLDIIEDRDGIKHIQLDYDEDLVVEGTDYGIKVISNPKNISKTILIEGRDLKSDDEIVLDKKMKTYGFKIGDEIHFRHEVDKFGVEEDAEDSLKRYTFKVVGFVDSMEFAQDVTRGSSKRGLGELKGFSYIEKSNFKKDPTIARIILEDTGSLKTSSSKYKNILKHFSEGLKIDLKHRPDERLLSIRTDIEGKIEDGEEKIEDAKVKLLDAREELDEGKEKLDDSKKKYREGVKEYEDQVKKGKEKLDDSKKKLDDGKNEIDKNENKLTDAKEKLDEGKEKLEKGQSDYEKGREEFVSGEAKLKSAKETLDMTREELRKGRAKLDEGWMKIEESKRKLSDAKREIDENQVKLDEGRKKYEEGLLDLQIAIGAKGLSLDATAQRIEDMDKALEAAQRGLSDLESVDKAIEDAEVGIKEAKTKKEEIDRDILDYENQLQNPTLTEEQKEQKRKTLDSLKKQSEMLQETIDASEKNVEKLKENKALANIALETLKKQFGNEITPEKISKYRQELQAAKEGIKKLQAAKEELDAGQKKLDEGRVKYEAGLEELQRGIETAEKGEREYQENLAKYQDGLRKYEEGISELEGNRKKIDDAKAELEKAKKDYEKGLSDYENGRGKLDSAKESLKEGIKSYEEGKNTFENETSKVKNKLEDARRKLDKGSRDLLKGENEYLENKEKADEEIKDAEDKIEHAKNVLKILGATNYTVEPRYQNPDINTYLDYSSRVDMLTAIFPVFFFLISMLVCWTTMTRMVEENRINIGTYKALGYKNFDIAKKYLFYGETSALIGGIIGSIFGVIFLSRLIGNAYSTDTIFMDHLLKKVYPFRTLAAILAGLSSTGITAALTVRKSQKNNAATLLRGIPPKKGTRILLERIKPIWNRMTFLQKVTARNIFRYKKRMIMTILGIMGCSALLVLGFGIEGSVKGIKEKQFKEIIKYDVGIVYDKTIDDKEYEKFDKKIDEIKEIKEEAKFRMEGFKAGFKAIDQDVNLVVPENMNEFKNFYELRKRSSKEPIEIPKSGVVVTEKLSELLHLKKGDVLIIKDDHGDEISMQIADIAEMYAGHSVFMGRDYYEKVFGKEFVSNARLIKTESLEDKEKVTNELMDYKVTLGTIDVSVMEKILDNFMYSISLVVITIIAASSMLAIIVLYNLTNINIEERKREISTIKVLGFYAKEVTQYVYRETLSLTVIGIIVGLIVGKFLHYGVLQVVVPYRAMLDPHLIISAYILSAIITIVVTIGIMVVFHKKLQKIDMVSALKAQE